jgi:geranylgeranyl pyrophosphate synthase
VATLGDPLGRIVQINDDLKDALEKPAGPDWQRQWTNLPILFARIADHEDRERFLELIPQVADRDRLEEAQAILVRSGAFSYCAYQLIEAYKEALATIARLDLPNPDSLRSLIEIQVVPLRKLLRSVGIENVDAVFSV